MKKGISKSTEKQSVDLLAILSQRFEKHMERHRSLAWSEVEKRLLSAKNKLPMLHMMEDTGGEPDVIGYSKEKAAYIFCDCSAESPSGRRSLCYDPEALHSRKENKPKGSAMALAEEMGIEMLTEGQYRSLQKLGKFDTKTSSWVQTPEKIRKLGGALFCDRRYDEVFLYHNGAESYYAARGFRGLLYV